MTVNAGREEDQEEKEKDEEREKKGRLVFSVFMSTVR